MKVPVTVEVDLSALTEIINALVKRVATLEERLVLHPPAEPTEPEPTDPEPEQPASVFTSMTATRTANDQVHVEWTSSQAVTAAITVYADDGQWTAPASTGTYGAYEFAYVPPSMAAKFVVRAGEDSRSISIDAVGAPADPGEPEPEEPPAPVTGKFTVQAGKIIGPDGHRFRLLGPNVGIPNAFDWRGSLPAERALLALRKWGWNTVKPCAYSPEHMPQVDTYGHIDKIVKDLTPHGIVVQIVNRDNADQGWWGNYSEANTERFWRTMAVKYGGNPYVWFNVACEPKAGNDEWVRYHQKMIDAIRGAGAQNVIILDPPVAGQDVGPEYNGNRYFLDLVPQLRNVGAAVYSPHTYGWAKWQLGPESFRAWVRKHQQAGWPVVVGEVGWTADGSTTAGSFESNRTAGRATFEAWKSGDLDGIVYWHGTHGDLYSTQANGNAFWDGADGMGLSEMGRELRALTT